MRDGLRKGGLDEILPPTAPSLLRDRSTIRREGMALPQGPAPKWTGQPPAVQGLPRVGRLVHRLSKIRGRVPGRAGRMPAVPGVRLRRTIPALMRLLVCREAGIVVRHPGRQGDRKPPHPCPLPQGEREPPPEEDQASGAKEKRERARRAGTRPPINRSPDYSPLGASTGGGSTLLRRRPRKGCTPNSVSFSESMP